MNSHLEIFRTNQPHEVLRVLNEFKDRAIPHFGQEQSVTGIKEAMPQTPVPSPGVAWAVLVPPVAIDEAKGVLEELGLVSHSEKTLWSNGPAEASPLLRYVYIFILIIFVTLMVGEITKW